MNDRTQDRTQAHAPTANRGRAAIMWLVALAALLLIFVWRMVPAQIHPPAIAIGIYEEPKEASAADAPLLVGVERRGEVDQRIHVAVASEAAVTADAGAAPVEWTLRFSIARSKLRKPAPHLVEARRRESSYHAAIFLASGKSIEFGRNELPESAPVELSFQHSNFEPLVNGASVVLATCPQGVGSTADVFFIGEHGRSGILLRDALSIDIEARIIELGQLSLEPVPYLGTVTVHPRDDAPSFHAFISSMRLESGSLGKFGRQAPGRLQAFPSAGGEAEVYSFSPSDRWSVLFKTAQGELIASHEAAMGEDISIEYERPAGVSVSVDLERYADASRILFVAGGVPRAEVLDGAGFDARLGGAMSSNAIPIPRFRTAGAPFTTGVAPLDEGRVRVELWSRRSVDGVVEWKLLHSEAATLAGDVVELRF